MRTYCSQHLYDRLLDGCVCLLCTQIVRLRSQPPVLALLLETGPRSVHSASPDCHLSLFLQVKEKWLVGSFGLERSHE